MTALSPEEINNELHSVRLKITEVSDEMEWIESSNPPKNEAYQQFCQSIDLHAADFKFHPQIFDIFKVTGSPAEYGGTRSDLGPLLCGLLSDEIKKNIKHKIDALDYQAGPPVAERPGLIKDLKSELFELEQRQEELIVVADKVGIHINRPEGFNPAAVLGFTP